MGRRSGVTTCARIIHAFSERDEWPQPELAVRCGVQVRALREVLEEMRDAGLAVERIEYSGREVSWRWTGWMREPRAVRPRYRGHDRQRP